MHWLGHKTIQFTAVKGTSVKSSTLQFVSIQKKNSRCRTFYKGRLEFTGQSIKDLMGDVWTASMRCDAITDTLSLPLIKVKEKGIWEILGVHFWTFWADPWCGISSTHIQTDKCGAFCWNACTPSLLSYVCLIKRVSKRFSSDKPASYTSLSVGGSIS